MATDSKQTFEFRSYSSIADIGRKPWQSLKGSEHPFSSFDYLHGLEHSGAVSAGTGWQAAHLAAYNQSDELVFAMPLYLREDSWGEFVFDFSWADAHHRYGVPYYPKLTCAIPFTPVTGPRWLKSGTLAHPHDSEIIEQLAITAEQHSASSWHALFISEDNARQLGKHQILVRKDCQYHWINCNYTNFDDFLAAFRSASRKKTRRERRRVEEAGLVIDQTNGSLLDDKEWEDVYELYASSFYKRGRAPYFPIDFFNMISQSELLNILVIRAFRDSTLIAVSLFFVTDDVLYGRYWGCREFVDGLHFELCYYQGIEYCIQNRIARFDPGVQGEHKIARGFEAAASWSAHWIRRPEFSQAIANFLKQERQHIDAYMDEVNKHVPFRTEWMKNR